MKETSGYIRPEWGDAKAVRLHFGLCKTTIYRLADEGKIRTSSLRERGKLRGKRLFSLDSIAAFIESRATGGEFDASFQGNPEGESDLTQKGVRVEVSETSPLT
ncbi:MAG: helix-turn-helix domain-containing protein [Luteolibacter sp.]